MKKLMKHKGFKRHKSRLVSSNRMLLAALAGAVTGLAITYLLESEKGRSLLSQAGSSLKMLAGNIQLPTLLRG